MIARGLYETLVTEALAAQLIDNSATSSVDALRSA
jgi:hypothetical protein